MNRSRVIRPSGRSINVKNLGWLLNNWKVAQRFTVHPHPVDSSAVLTAHMRDGSSYKTDFMDSGILHRWLNRPVFRGASVKWNGVDHEIGSPSYHTLNPIMSSKSRVVGLPTKGEASKTPPKWVAPWGSPVKKKSKGTVLSFGAKSKVDQIIGEAFNLGAAGAIAGAVGRSFGGGGGRSFGGGGGGLGAGGVPPPPSFGGYGGGGMRAAMPGRGRISVATLLSHPPPRSSAPRPQMASYRPPPGARPPGAAAPRSMPTGAPSRPATPLLPPPSFDNAGKTYTAKDGFKYTDRDVMTVALTTHAENLPKASYEGRKAVAYTMSNRARIGKEGGWSSSPFDVATQRDNRTGLHQYSVWDRGNEHTIAGAQRAAAQNTPEWQLTLKATHAALGRTEDDNSGGATNYMNRAVVRQRGGSALRSGGWGTQTDKITVPSLDGHTFYKFHDLPPQYSSKPAASAAKAEPATPSVKPSTPAFPKAPIAAAKAKPLAGPGLPDFKKDQGSA